MSNTYGFDFLKSQHATLDQVSSGSPQLSNLHDDHASDAAAPIDPSAYLELQYTILAFLQKHRGSGCLAPTVIAKATGIDLDVHTEVADMLQRNSKVRVEMVPDPENPALSVATYAYQAKYSNVRDRTTLLAQVNRMTSGVPMRDLLDSYSDVEKDLAALITAGDIIAVTNTEDKDKTLFPRGEAFLVELDGLITLPDVKPAPVVSMNGATHAGATNGNKSGAAPGQQQQQQQNGHPPPIQPPTNNPALMEPTEREEIYTVETDMDPRKQVRRGEAIQVGGQWFRVSSAVREGPLSEQPARAQAPLSVVSLTDLPKRNEVDGYIRPLSGQILPLDGPLSVEAAQNTGAAKAARERLHKLAHGRSGGVTSQLLGSHAHSSNPTTLATSFAASTVGHQSIRKRPNIKVSKDTSTSSSGQQKQSSREALQKAASDPALALYSHARRHGVTRDVREMYLATRSAVPESDEDLHKLLLEHKLLEPDEQMRRPRLVGTSANVDNDGKPKKRRYYERKNQRITNTHLENTEIGAILARALEKQQQGKAVGDGGM